MESAGDTEIDEQSFGRPVEEMIRQREVGQDYQASREYLDHLYRGNAGQIKGPPPDAAKVNESFAHLEAYLGEAGRRCIEQYHQWGHNFWQTEEPKLLNGILKAYWHQVNIVASMRKKIMDMYDPVQLILPISPEMLSDFDQAIADLSQDGEPLAQVPEEDRQKYINLFRIEVGHLRSINQKITRNIGMQCSDDLVQCQADPERKAADTWAELVSTVMGKWKRKDTIREDVLDHFQTFLLMPDLNNWNRLIASLVLWKYQVKFVKEKKTILLNFKAARKFMAFAVKHLQTELKTVDFTDDGYPKGYLGMILLFSDRDKEITTQDWQAVNFLVSGNAGDNQKEPIDLLEELDEGLEVLVGQGEDIRDEALVLSKALGSEEEDSSIQSELDRPVRKTKGKKTGRRGRDEEPAPKKVMDFGFSSEADPEIRNLTEDKLMSDMRQIARFIKVIRDDDTSPKQKEQATDGLYNKITRDKFLKEFLETLCKVGYAQEPAQRQQAVEESFQELDRRAEPMQEDGDQVEFEFFEEDEEPPAEQAPTPPLAKRTRISGE